MHFERWQSVGLRALEPSHCNVVCEYLAANGMNQELRNVMKYNENLYEMKSNMERYKEDIR